MLMCDDLAPLKSCALCRAMTVKPQILVGARGSEAGSQYMASPSSLNTATRGQYQQGRDQYPQGQQSIPGLRINSNHNQGRQPRITTREASQGLDREASKGMNREVSMDMMMSSHPL